MIRTILVSTGLMTLCLLLQSTYLQGISVYSTIPDLSLIVLIYVAVRNGSMEGQISGFAAGIVADVISASPLGFNIIIKTVIGFLYGLLFGNFFIDAIFIPLLLGFSGVIIKALVANLIHLIFSSIPAYAFFEKELWFHAVYTSVISPFVFLLLNLVKPIIISEQNRV